MNVTDHQIYNARHQLNARGGGMDLLLSLVSFDPTKRATPLQVLNSTFMSCLQENMEEPASPSAVQNDESEDVVHSYMSYTLS